MGPFLFLVSINELYFNIDSKLLLFADNTTIFSSHYDPISAVSFRLMISFVEPFHWFASNKLPLNNSTTQTINNLL